MTDPPPVPGAGWRVDIPMPTRGGRPVGWITLNNIKKMSWRTVYNLEQAWHKAAYDALRNAHIPAGLGRIRLTIQFRFADNRGRDRDNLEPTIKPCIDALKPQKVKHTTDRRGRPKLSVQLGVGVITDDNTRLIERAADLPDGDTLGRTNPVHGMVIFRITPLPQEVHTT